MTAPPFEIRTARSADARALSGLLDELGFPASPEVVAARLAALDRSGEAVLVCARGDDVLGVATLHVTRVLHRPTPVGRVTALVVAAHARKQGIGRALIAAAETHLAQQGCALIEVTSNQRLEAAHTFYEHLGYDRTSFRFRKTLPATPDPADPR